MIRLVKELGFMSMTSPVCVTREIISQSPHFRRQEIQATMELISFDPAGFEVLTSQMNMFQTDCAELGIPFGQDMLEKIIVVELIGSPAPLNGDGTVNENHESLSIHSALLYSLEKSIKTDFHRPPTMPTTTRFSLTAIGSDTNECSPSTLTLHLPLTEAEYEALQMEAKVPLMFALKFSYREQKQNT